MSAIHIFVSYAREDIRFMGRREERGRWIADDDAPSALIPWLAKSKFLQKHDIRFWYDQKDLVPSDEFRRLIEEEIDKAHIAIVLISHGFLNSEFIQSVEFPLIKARAERGELLVMPILVEPCPWEDDDFLSSRHMVPGKPTPLIDYLGNEVEWAHVRDELLRGLEKTIKKLTRQEPESRPVQTTIVEPVAPRNQDFWRRRLVVLPLALFVVAVAGLLILRPWNFGSPQIHPPSDNSLTAKQIMPPTDSHAPEAPEQPIGKQTAAAPNPGLPSAMRDMVPHDQEATSGKAQDFTPGAELLVTDVNGGTTLLNNATIRYSGGLGPSDERTGIRVKSGISEFTLTWDKLAKLTIETIKKKKVEGAIEKEIFTYKAEMKLRDGTGASVDLLEDWNMSYMDGGGAGLLFGQTNLGDIKIRFCDIKSIEPVSASSTSQAVKELPATPIPAVAPTTPSSDASATAAVTKAVEAFQLERKNVGYGSYIWEDKNSRSVWQSLYSECKGKEIPAIIAQLSSDAKSPHKLLVLLRYSSRMDEGIAQAGKIMEAVCAHGVTQKDYETQNVAFEIVQGLRVTNDEKWSHLVKALSAAPNESVPKIASALTKSCPPERREATRVALLDTIRTVNDRYAETPAFELTAVTSPEKAKETVDALLSAMQTIDTSYRQGFVNAIASLTPKSDRSRVAGELLRDFDLTASPYIYYGPRIIRVIGEWNAKDVVPLLRRLLPTNESQLGESLADVLSAWGDKESIPLIRDAVTQRRDETLWAHVLPRLLLALRTLEDPKAAELAADVLASAPQEAQEAILIDSSFAQWRDPRILDAAKALLKTTNDEKVKTAVAKFMRS